MKIGNESQFKWYIKELLLFQKKKSFKNKTYLKGNRQYRKKNFLHDSLIS